MCTRTIMIFPQFENMEVIDLIRKKYDSLVELVKPHITIVFPFESKMTNEEIAAILDNRLQEIGPFILKMQGISKVEDSFGNYLFLNVIEGGETIIKLHNLLYENEFSHWDLKLRYIPHMTIGKLEDAAKLQDAFEDTKCCTDVFTTTVNKISVEMIGEHEESIIVIEKEL